jgi:outer membrane protein assembly factor BamB
LTRRTLFIALVAAIVRFVPASSGLALPNATSHWSFSLHAGAPRPSGQWSMFMNGPRRQGRSSFVGAQSSQLAWRLSMETNYGGAVIGRDGTIYLGEFLGQLLALNPDGTTKWSISVSPYDIESTPAILRDGRIAFVDQSGTVTVVNPDGTLSWRFHSHTACDCPEMSPAVGADGTVYTAIGQTVYALASDGRPRWSYDVGRTILGPPAVAPNGVVYVAASYLYALNPNGTLRWQTTDLLGLGGSPDVGAQGTIYVNAFDPTVYAFNPDGTLKWSYQADPCCNTGVPSSPAIGQDGTIYAGERISGGHGVMLALDPDGTLRWETTAASGCCPTAPSIGGDGTIYFGSGSSVSAPAPSVFALNPDGTLKWEYDEPDGGYIRTAPAIGRGQRVYAGSDDAFFAIGP